MVFAAAAAAPCVRRLLFPRSSMQQVAPGDGRTDSWALCTILREATVSTLSARKIRVRRGRNCSGRGLPVCIA
jgi:hypothetical protein